MTPVNPKIREAAVLAGRAKLGEQHRRKNQSDRDKLRVENEQLRALLQRVTALPVEQARTEIEGLRAEIERLRALVLDACRVLNHYDLPEHAFHYRRALKDTKP